MADRLERIVGGKVVSEHSTAMLTPEMVAHYWGKMSEQLLLVSHIWEDYYTLDHFYNEAMCGGMQVWGAGDDSKYTMFVFSQILIYPKCRTLSVMLALGHGVDLVLPSIFASMEKFAKMTGCTFIDGIGRVGWDPRLKALGAVRKGFAYQYRVGEGRMQ